VRLPTGPEDSPAIESASALWTYGDLARAAEALAAHLTSLGTPASRPGSQSSSLAALRIGHAFDLSPEAIVAVHGVARARAELAPAHTGWTEAQVGRYVASVAPDAVLASPGHPWLHGWNRIALALPGFGPVDLLTRAADVEPLLECRADPSVERDGARAVPEGTDVLLSTSGSDGEPQVVCHSWKGLRANARASNARGEAGEDAVTLATLAWAHVGGLAIIVRATEGGGRIVCGPSRFDAAMVLEAIERHDVTHVSVVPVMLERILAAPGEIEPTATSAPRSLRQVLTGGAAIPRRLLERALEAGWPVSPTYGLTEAGSQVATIDPEAAARRAIGVLDRPLDGVEIRVGDDGDVSVRSPSIMLGYLEQPARENPVDADGWFGTGDLAARDESGALHVIGRRSSRIITGGTNVDPREVEDVLRGHPAVDDVCVVGVADERWGEIVVAVVAVGSGVTGHEASLREWSRQLLDGPRRPRRWKIVDRLPSTPNGKVDRHAVLAAAERG